jgi:hypothetical protein
VKASKPQTKRLEARRESSSSGDPSLKAPAALELFYFSGFPQQTSQDKAPGLLRQAATSKAPAPSPAFPFSHPHFVLPFLPSFFSSGNFLPLIFFRLFYSHSLRWIYRSQPAASGLPRVHPWRMPGFWRTQPARGLQEAGGERLLSAQRRLSAYPGQGFVSFATIRYKDKRAPLLRTRQRARAGDFAKQTPGIFQPATGLMTRFLPQRKSSGMAIPC